MKALVIAIGLALLAFPATATPVDSLPDILDQLFGWFVTAWEEIEQMIDLSGTPEEGAQGVDSASELPGEIGPGIDPIGSSGG